jgi:hypothetical protein
VLLDPVFFTLPPLEGLVRLTGLGLLPDDDEDLNVMIRGI